MRRRRDPHELGQTMVEFALVIIIVLLLMVGILDFGRVVFASNDASHAARDAVRQASVSPLDCDSIYFVVQHQTQGQSAVTASVEHRSAPSADPNAGWASICPAYDPAITYDDDPTTGVLSAAAAGIGEEVRVVINNDVALATPLMSNLVGGSLSVGGSSSMAITYVPVP